MRYVVCLNRWFPLQENKRNCIIEFVKIMRFLHILFETGFVIPQGFCIFKKIYQLRSLYSIQTLHHEGFAQSAPYSIP